MKGLVLEQNGLLVFKDVAEPVVADDECLIAVKNAGICNSDINRAFGNGAYHYPLIMGHEFSGVVKQIGKRTTKFNNGDHVVVFPLLPCNKCPFCKDEHFAQCSSYGYYGSRQDGGFAEYIAVNEWNLLKLPDDISLEQAALIEPIAVALHSLKKADVQEHEHVAILGAGFIGLVAANVLSMAMDKEKIFIIDRNRSKLTFASDFGVNTICTTETPDWPAMLKKHGIDVVIEMCGATEMFKHSLNIVNNFGRVIWVGNITGDVTIEKSTVSSILRRELLIKGVWNSSFRHYENDDWHQAIQYLQANSVRNLITHVVDLRDGAEFLKLLKEKRLTELVGAKKPYIKGLFSIIDN